MKRSSTLATLALGWIIVMTQVASAQAPNAATDPRIDPQVRAFFGGSQQGHQSVLDTAPAKAAGNPHRAAE